MFSTRGSSGGLRGRRRFGASQGVLSEMNVVPLVDVVLVLLIIFMLTAHVMDYGLEVNVPQVKSTKENTDELPTITITSDHTLHLNDKKINIHDLKARLQQQFKGQTTVYLRADASIRWELLANVMAELSAGKYQIRMVTKPMESGK
jgi:biopolymer transport protein ExbD